MTCLDLTLPTPAENLACDEALTEQCEAGGPEWLRFWEPASPFVVLGYANRLATEVNQDACRADGVPILRRVSGGGAVLQIPGCLNYALGLRLDEAGELATVAGANQFIMERNADAISRCLIPIISQPINNSPMGEVGRASPRAVNNQPRPARGCRPTTFPLFANDWGCLGQPVQVRGHTDLALRDRKFSGNSQRRYRRSLLFHGSLLLNADLSLLGGYLRFPSKTPDYRAGRSHADFVTNLPLPAAAVKDVLRQAWQAHSESTAVPLDRIRALVAEKYARAEWNEKF
jgi:lipoate-protein ligase A